MIQAQALKKAAALDEELAARLEAMEATGDIPPAERERAALEDIVALSADDRGCYTQKSAGTGRRSSAPPESVSVDDNMKDLDLIDLPPVSPERLAAAKRVLVDLLVEEALVEIRKESAET